MVVDQDRGYLSSRVCNNIKDSAMKCIKRGYAAAPTFLLGPLHSHLGGRADQRERERERDASLETEQDFLIRFLETAVSALYKILCWSMTITA